MKGDFGRVDQLGMIATLASWRPRVQIPPRPPNSSRHFAFKTIENQVFSDHIRIIFASYSGPASRRCRHDVCPEKDLEKSGSNNPRFTILSLSSLVVSQLTVTESEVCSELCRLGLSRKRQNLRVLRREILSTCFCASRALRRIVWIKRNEHTIITQACANPSLFLSRA